MKYISIAIVLFTILSCENVTITESNPINIDNDWKKLKLKGNVKAIKEIKFLAIDDFSEVRDCEKVDYIYNKEVLFNLDGYKIEQNDYIPDGTLANRIMYMHQENKLVEYNEYDSQGMLFGTGKYELGDDGMPKRLNYKTNDGRLNWSKSYKYDNNNNIIEVTHYSADNIIKKQEKYKYDNKGLLVESELYKDNKLVTKNTYENDNEGSNTQLTYGEDTSVFTYVYNYDSKGNWVKKIVFENNNPSGILVREIEYFN